MQLSIKVLEVWDADVIPLESFRELVRSHHVSLDLQSIDSVDGADTFSSRES